MVYVLFDTAASGTMSLDDPLSTGFRIIGGPHYRAGTQVAATGDVNGDGRGGLLLDAPDPRSGGVFVLFAGHYVSRKAGRGHE